MNENWATLMMEIFTAAYLSENEGRVPVTVEEVKDFNRNLVVLPKMEDTSDLVVDRLLGPIKAKAVE
jgi:hypothetical protein